MIPVLAMHFTMVGKPKNCDFTVAAARPFHVPKKRKTFQVREEKKTREQKKYHQREKPSGKSDNLFCDRQRIFRDAHRCSSAKHSRAPTILHCAAMVLTATRAGAWKSPSPAFFSFRSRQSQDTAGCKAGPLLQNLFSYPKMAPSCWAGPGVLPQTAQQKKANVPSVSPPCSSPNVALVGTLSCTRVFRPPPLCERAKPSFLRVLYIRVHFLSLCFSCDRRKGQQAVKGGHDACVNARKYTLR